MDSLRSILFIKSTEYLTSTFDIHYSIFAFFEFLFRLNWPLFRPAAGLIRLRRNTLTPQLVVYLFPIQNLKSQIRNRRTRTPQRETRNPKLAPRNAQPELQLKLHITRHAHTFQTGSPVGDALSAIPHDVIHLPVRALLVQMKQAQLFDAGLEG